MNIKFATKFILKSRAYEFREEILWRGVKSQVSTFYVGLPLSSVHGRRRAPMPYPPQSTSA